MAAVEAAAAAAASAEELVATQAVEERAEEGAGADATVTAMASGLLAVAKVELVAAVKAMAATPAEVVRATHRMEPPGVGRWGT